MHAGETLSLLTYCGWHAVRYESNVPREQPCLSLPLPGVREDVVFWVPREARFVWPDELRQRPRYQFEVDVVTAMTSTLDAKVCSPEL